MSTSSPLLIIGNGGAAVHAIQAARVRGHQGRIQALSDIDGPTFSPMLSPYYLAGEIPYDRCFPFGKEFYKRYEVNCRFASPVEALDPLNKEAYLQGGERLPYDRCLIATGAEPLIPEVPGLTESRHVFVLRTPQETTRLSQALLGAKKSLVLGASLVGIKLADILVKRGIAVTVVDVADQILPYCAHGECASLLQDRIRKNGVDLCLGFTIEGAEEGLRETKFYFNGGVTIEADLFLACTGIRPCLDIVKGTQVEVDEGVLVDDRMRTTVEDVYAAGDVSQGMNLLTGKRQLIGLWRNACQQGRTAGFNMAGADVSYPGTIPHHISSFFGMTFVHLGDVKRQGTDVQIISHQEPSKARYHLLVFNNGMLVGANLINDFHNAGRLMSTIVRRLDWGVYIEKLMRGTTDQEINQILGALHA